MTEQLPDIDLDFTPIRISTLRGDRKIEFNVYIKVGTRHILYCRKGDSFEGDRLARLKEKKLAQLYVLGSEMDKYNKYIKDNIEEAFDLSKTKDLVTRTEIIQGHQQALAEDIIEDPDNVSAYEMAKNSCFKMMEYIQKEELSLKCLLAIENDDLSISHHGVNVAGMAIALAQKLQNFEKNDDNIALMALGALIHDFGHKNLNINLVTPREDLSPEDWATYITHPSIAAEKLRRLPHFDTLVVNVIHEHEEHIDGSGFPQGLVQRTLDPLVLIVAVVNIFDRYVSFQGMHPIDALKEIIIDKMGQLPLDMMTGLNKMLAERHCLTKATR